MTLTKKHIEKLNIKEKLLEKKKNMEKQLSSMKNSLNFGDDIDSFEEEADEAEEYANYLGIKQVLDRQLLNIEDALDHIKKGDYGLCKKCKKEISIELLKIEPESTLCKKCKKEIQEQ